MSQNLRSPELGLTRIESDDSLKRFTSKKTHENKNCVPSHGQPSCSYDKKEGLPKEHSQTTYEPLEQYNNKIGMHSMLELSTDNYYQGEIAYQTQQPFEKSPIRSSKDEDFQQDNIPSIDQKKCRIWSSEDSSFVMLESKYEDEDCQREMIDKQEKNNIINKVALDKLGISQDCPSLVELQIPIDNKMVMNSMDRGSIACSENHLKKMMTQQKQRTTIKTNSNNKLCSDVSLERFSYSYGSPKKCWVKMLSKNEPQDHIQFSGLPRITQGITSSRNSIGCRNTLNQSPNIATPMEAHLNGQRKLYEDGNKAKSLNILNENDSEQYKISSKQEPQRLEEVTIEYNQDSSIFDSKFLECLNKISKGGHLNLDERATQSSTAIDLAEFPSPIVNVELKRKVEELERLVADERKKFQEVTKRLVEQQEEVDKNVQQMQDDWDGKIRELQKEKYALSIRLQSTETAHLASLLAGQESQVQNIQSAMQPNLSMMPPLNGSTSQRRVSIHHHHEEFLKELEVDQARVKFGIVKAPQITKQEAKKLKQEILQQEVLIRGYQHENEKAMQKIKEIQGEAKEKARIMVEENAKLASQLLQCQHHAMASGPQAATELSLQEALDREAQLKRLEVQLKQEIARLKDELIKAHAELDQMEKRVSKTLNDLECELTSLKNSLSKEQENHAHTSLTKEEVTKSLEENQRLLSALQITTEQQAAQIIELRNKVAIYKGDGTNLDKSAEEGGHISLQDKRSALVDDRRRIQPPLKQTRKPELGCRVMKPGLSALVQVSREDSEKVRRLQMELSILRKQSNTKEDESNRRLHMLKLELEKTKQEYEKRLQCLQTFHLHLDPTSTSEQVAQNRVKALETQVVNIRIHYSRKLKELTDKLAESKNEQTKFKLATENANLQKKIPVARTVKVKELMDAKERIGMLEDVLDHKDHTIKSLQQKLGQIQIDGKGDDTSAPNSITAKQAASLAKIKRKIQSGSPRREHPIQSSSLLKVRDSQEFSQASLQPCSAATLVDDSQEPQEEPKIRRGQDSPNESEADIVSLRKQLIGETEVSREALQQQCLEAMDKATRCSITHQQSLHHLQQASKMNIDNHISRNFSSKKSGSKELDWRSYNDPLERENRALQARLQGLSEELEEDQAQVRKPIQVQSFSVDNVHHNRASANVREEMHGKGSLFSHENPRRGLKWWQFG